MWKFKVKPDHQGKFEEIYGPNGRWAQLFRRADGYLGTELLRDTIDEFSFVTIDAWNSLSDFEAFKRIFQTEYTALDTFCEPLTQDESVIGSFSTV